MIEAAIIILQFGRLRVEQGFPILKRSIRLPFFLEKTKLLLFDNVRKTYLANGQPFKLLGITYLIGKIKFELFFQGPLAK